MSYQSQNYLFNYFCYLCVLFLLSTAYCQSKNPLKSETYEICSCEARQPKDLRNLTNTELRAFFESFDIVLTDIDGVLWQGTQLVPGVVDTLTKLNNNSKKIVLVTNNSIFPIRHYVRILEEKGYSLTPDNIVIPSDTLIWYLRSIGFSGKALVVGSYCFKESLVNAKIEITTGPSYVEEDLHILDNLTKIDPDIKAVIVEFDFNVNWAKIIQAGIYVENKDILFLVGASDKKFPASKSQIIIGGGYFQDILVQFTKRKPLLFAKPGDILKDFIFERYNITDPRRILFIGDSLNVDMEFADLCGFQKLWVGSGVDGSDMSQFTQNQSIPHYYLPDLSKMPFNDDKFKNLQ